MTQSQAIVKQDRDAAADFMSECAPYLGDCGMKNSVELALRQAFARHRQSAETGSLAELRSALEQLAARAPKPEYYGYARPLRCQACQYRGHVDGEERHGRDCAYVIARTALASIREGDAG
jgi:hypothetical protein